MDMLVCARSPGLNAVGLRLPPILTLRVASMELQGFALECAIFVDSCRDSHSSAPFLLTVARIRALAASSSTDGGHFVDGRRPLR